MKTSKKYDVYCSTSFDWKSKRGTANGSELIVADTMTMDAPVTGVFVKSAKTGVVKYFEPIYDEDGYDGEFMVYGYDNISVTIWNY
jgi:hypothetical protein